MDTQQTSERQPKIHTAICKIMQEIGGVEKSRKNQQQGYSFRGIADVYLACQPVMAKHGVHVAPVEICDQTMTVGKSSTGKDSYHITMRVKFRAFAEDGSWVPVETIGEAIDSSDKAANKAMSQAMKYCLVQLFALPEEDPEIDTEHDHPEMKTGGQAQAKGKAEKESAPEDKIKAAKVRAVAIAIAKAGISDADRKDWMGIQLGKEVPSSKDLSIAELDVLLAKANQAQQKGAA